MEEAWEVIAVTSGMANANIIAGRLAVEGIPTRLKYDVAGYLYAVTIDGLGAVTIMVPEGDRGRAQEILSQTYESSEGEN